MNEILQGALFASRLITIALTAGAVIGFVLYLLGVFPDVKAEKDTKRKVARGIAIMLGFTMMILGTLKILRIDTMVYLWDTVFHMAYMMTPFGIMEITLGLLLLFPITFKLGVLLLTASLGGSMSIHFPTFSDGPGAIVASLIMLGLLWLSAVLYTPEMFPDFISKWFHKTKQETIENNVPTPEPSK